MRPELFAVRAVNQYRRRDILAYVGLRYYLENTCTVNNNWIQDVSMHLIRTRSEPAYYHSYHFKEINQDDSVMHRNIYIPSPNEILVETALLNQCANDPAFQTLSCVYSYQFPEANSKEGVYRSYFPGFRERHRSVRNICLNSDESIVLYTDIRKFYPSISKELALETWEGACVSSSIPRPYWEIGRQLLTDHAEISEANDDGLGILTGPMFSHLIANLVLSKVDAILFKETNGRYWRYVDDIILVGDPKQINSGRSLLETILNDLGGFELHDTGKDFEVPSSEWLKGANDFDSATSTPWMRLIANIKRFLVVRPNEREELERKFLENSINIPLLDYENIVREASSREKIFDWMAKYSWAPRTVRALTTDRLLQNALSARQFYFNKTTSLLESSIPDEGYERRRLIPKLRYYVGRLVYLATPEMLSVIISSLDGYPELLLLKTVMETIQTRDVTNILRLGANAVQAAAQVLRIKNQAVICSLTSLGTVEIQSLSILRLNGIQVTFTSIINDGIEGDPLSQFSLGINPLELMRATDPFIKEIACLRGVQSPLRHVTMINTAFDRDESLTFDAINNLYDSGY